MRRHTCSRPARGGRVVNGGAWLEIDGSVVDWSTATFTRYAAGQRLRSTDAWPTRRRATWFASRKYLGVIDSDLYKQTPALEAEGYVSALGTSRGRGSITTYHITKEGETARCRSAASWAITG